ncbi:MAG: GNAT family N-acetyltransferase [Aquimonas sp.]|nr:GNAT family N-acetyltransferase [Aquimonas sp.]
MSTAIPEGFQIEQADYRRDFDTLRAIRDEVFVRGQQVPIEIELDALDPLCQHVIARAEDGRAIGTARLMPDGRIGRMAVQAPWRGRGVGGLMLERLIEIARGRGLRRVELHSQVHAQAFYERHSFEAFGEHFFEAGIEHVHMQRALDLTPPARSAPSELLNIDSEHEARSTCLALLARTRHRLSIFSRDLDPVLLGGADVIEALRGLLARGRGVELRILLQDPASLMRDLHPWLPLMQRLSSLVHVRSVVEPIDRQNPVALIVNDTGGWYHRPLAARFEGTASLQAPGRARQLQNELDALWERGQPSTELRVLGGL